MHIVGFLLTRHGGGAAGDTLVQLARFHFNEDGEDEEGEYSLNVLYPS